jgi:hypothetical protein
MAISLGKYSIFRQTHLKRGLLQQRSLPSDVLAPHDLPTGFFGWGGWGSTARCERSTVAGHLNGYL